MPDSQYSDLEIASGPFTYEPESLQSFKCPDWFRDAKFAIWSHWGPQSVPMFGDWYARQLYLEGGDQYRHHLRVYGHPSKTGWKDIIPHWKAENFDPDGLMTLFVEAGSKYFVGQAMHHDNFDNFDSAHTRWNSVNMGPKKDICKMWQEAAKAKGLPFGLTEHLAASFFWWEGNKRADKSGPYVGVPYDGVNPEFADLYWNNDEVKTKEWDWYWPNEYFIRHWFARIKDVIDKFQPDLLYSDGGVPFDEVGRRIIAHLYNTSASVYGENIAVYNQKDTKPEIYTFGVLDIERGQMTEIAEHPWQTDTSIGDWFYNVKDDYKSPAYVLETLVDIVSTNGNLLLNIPQKPDGTLDEECTFLLKQLAIWMKGNGKGLFGSRPWTQFGEGPSAAGTGAFHEKRVEWTTDDFRFTRKGETVFAYQMKPSDEGTGIVRALATGKSRKVTAVRSLEFGSAEFIQTFTGLNFKHPAQPMQIGPAGLEITFE